MNNNELKQSFKTHGYNHTCRICLHGINHVFVKDAKSNVAQKKDHGKDCQPLDDFELFGLHTMY